MNRSRVEAFSDGVFAIAITLLVLTISEPTSFLHLGTKLAHRWPSFVAYVVSFAIIGIMWINHHAVLENVRHINRTFVYLNFLLLMTIAFLRTQLESLAELSLVAKVHELPRFFILRSWRLTHTHG